MLASRESAEKTTEHPFNAFLKCSSLAVEGDYITPKQLAKMFVMSKEISVLLALHRIRRLGYMGRMKYDCLSKEILVGELLSSRPFHKAQLGSELQS